MIVPKLPKGRPSESSKTKYNQELTLFSKALLSFQDNVDFKISARGWCYQLEGFNAIDKSQFDIAEKAINYCRKNGYLPIDFTSEDVKRKADLIPIIDDDVDITLKQWKRGMFDSINNYSPSLLSDHTRVYIEVIVEKTDLKSLFRKVCKPYQIPITNGGGWSDINSRAALIDRCNSAHRDGKEVYILYCGDFDPAGIMIADAFIRNLKQLEDATGIDTGFINFYSFGLSYDYIIKNGLVWTDNLKTGGKRSLDDPNHPDHNKPYVKDYIKKYGVRKVEANAMLNDIDTARQLLQDNINRFVSSQELNEYEDGLIESRVELKNAFDKLWRAS